MRNKEFSPTTSSETQAEMIRKGLRARGEKTLNANLAALSQRKEELLKRRAEIDAKLAELGANEQTPMDASAPSESTDDSELEVTIEPVDSHELEETTELSEHAKNTIKRAKKNSGIRQAITGAAALALAGVIMLGVTSSAKKTERAQPDTSPVVATEEENSQEIAKGIRDGYDEEGMWLSTNHAIEKDGKWNYNSYKFANASVLAEKFDLDETEMVKYVAENQSESFADYLANFPSTLQPEGFKGLSILEAERRLESLSDDEYESIKQHFNSIMDDAFTRRVDVSGNFNNAFMRLKDKSGPITHDNMELVRCTSYEAKRFTEFYWLDEYGNPIGSMLVKMSPVYDRDGNITSYDGCLQVITPKGTVPDTHEGMEEITDTDPEGEETEERDQTEDTETDTGEPEDDTTEERTSGGDPDTGEPEDDTTEERTSGGDSDPEPTPIIEDETIIIPKDSENLTRIDNHINDDIAEDINTEKITITPTEDVTKVEEITEMPAAEEYHAPAPEIVQNEPSKEAEPVQIASPDQTSTNNSQPTNVISEENNYTTDLGGANAANAAESPVEANPEAQSAADAAEIPIEEAPAPEDVGGTELNDILRGLGIF